MNKNFWIKTYGCQINLYDSLKMEDLLFPFGYKKTTYIEQADLIILNTCHTKERAEEKLYLEINKLKKIKDKNDKVVIVVAGCTAQAEGEEIFSRVPYVDLVIGPQSYHHLPNLLIATEKKEKNLIELDFTFAEKFNLLPKENINKMQVKPSSVVAIQEGCDKFCSFCVVPYIRGAEFSRPLKDIYNEIYKLATKGTVEVVLTGQNVAVYHGINESNKNSNLVELIRRIADIKALQRISYITAHPADFTKELINLYAEVPKLIPFLHLSAQSGSDYILSKMNRSYSRNHYLDIVAKLRNIRKDIAFSSDFIVGFPEESDEDFVDTLDLVRKVRYSQARSFKYTPRAGTAAAARRQIPEHIKIERLSILQQELASQQLAYNQNYVDKSMPVLFEYADNYGQVVGKTEYMQLVHIENLLKISGNSLHGKIIDIKITGASVGSLFGEIFYANPISA